MELKIFELIGKHCAHDSDASHSAVAAWEMLNAPYFQGRMGHFQLARGSRHWKGGVGQDIELVQMYRDEQLLRTPKDMYESEWGRQLYTPQAVQNIPEDIQAGANKVLERARQEDPQLFQLLFEPTEEQISQRNQIKIDIVESQDLGNKLEQILGSGWSIDGSLRVQGQEYHSYDYNDRGGHYILAHNDREVAGILYLSALRAWTYGINYLSVGPAFRRMGIAGAMYSRAIEACQQDKRILVRTPPGEYAQERPDIPASFDRLCVESDVLHVQSNSTLMSSLGQWVVRLGYDKTFEIAKPLCDKFDAGERRDRSYDPDLVQAIAAVNEQLNAQTSVRRAKP